MLYNIKVVYLHCVFHGIRFKVNEDWESGKIPFFFYVPIRSGNEENFFLFFLFYYMILTFSFALMQKKKVTKRKNQGCTFLPTPALFYAKQKELASLKQLFVFNAP